MSSTTTTSHRPPPPKPLDLELTIISAKHLKNVNWRTGDLTPYAIFWLDPDRRLATKSDDSNSTKPIWNERHVIPIPPSPTPTTLTLEIFHSKPSDTPKPLVGTLRIPIDELLNPNDSNVVRVFDVRRPSGRPCGKIRLKLAIKDRPVQDYPQGYYYQTPVPRYPPPQTPIPPFPAPSPRPYQYGSYSDPYSGFYQGGYYSPAPRPYTDRPLAGDPGALGGLGLGPSPPSAPVDYAQYEHKQKLGDYAHIEHKQKPSGTPVDYAQYEHNQKLGGVPGDYAHIEHKQKPSGTPVDYAQYEHNQKLGGMPGDYAQYEHSQKLGGLPVDYAHIEHKQKPSGTPVDYAQYEHNQKLGGLPIDYAHIEHKQKLGGAPGDYAHAQYEQKLGGAPVDYAHIEHKQKLGGAPVDYAQYEHKQKLGSTSVDYAHAQYEHKLGSSSVDYTHAQYEHKLGSAPVDYAHAQYEQKHKIGKVGSVSGAGLGMEGGVGAVTGGVSGLGIDEGLRYHDEKVGERVEGDLNARELDDYSGYRRADY